MLRFTRNDIKIVKYLNSTEINYLFNESYLENMLWQKLIKKQVFPERQFYTVIGINKFILDFAVFCKTRNINIECDGDAFHTQIMDVYSDKKRNNILESTGWSVLRFTTYDISKEMKSTYNIINKTINKYGGVQDIKDFSNYKYLPDEDEHQLLFYD